MTKAVATNSSERLAGALAILLGLTSMVLLAEHPGGQARTFADMVHEEGNNQQQNLIVHGGFAIVLAFQMLCYGTLSARVAAARLASRAGVTFFAVGIAWMSLSLLFDGVVLPAVAVRYASDTEAARPLFVLVTNIVRFAMPVGLGFQALAVCGWSAAMLFTGMRISGGVGAVLGLILVAAIVVAMFFGMPMAMMAAIVGLGLWGVIAGAALLATPSA